MESDDKQARKLARAVFGENWETTTCKPYQAQMYFAPRFGLNSNAAFSEVLSPRLVRADLVPDNRETRRVTGHLLFCRDVVAVCDELERKARERAGAERRRRQAAA